MKTKICIVLLCLVSVYCIGQDSALVNSADQQTAKHLVVKGMPIDGDYNDFVSLFLNDGYELAGDGGVKNGVALKGVFAGKDANVLVSYTPVSHTVHSFLVMFEKSESFWTAKSNFNELVATYTKKYGIPQYIKREFSSPYYEGDGYENSAMRLGKVNYFANWELTEGNIIIYIMQSGSIVVAYQDAINGELNKKEKQENASYDI